MAQLWIQQMTGLVTPWLDSLSILNATNPWEYDTIAGGAYFFRRSWKEVFRNGQHHFPAFHLSLDVAAGSQLFRCCMRLEETNRDKSFVIPHSVSNFFGVVVRNPIDVGYHGHPNLVFDRSVENVIAPQGFERDSVLQAMPIILWMNIQSQFFQKHSGTIRQFCAF
jgi:hypothetical protein